MNSKLQAICEWQDIQTLFWLGGVGIGTVQLLANPAIGTACLLATVTKLATAYLSRSDIESGKIDSLTAFFAAELVHGVAFATISAIVFSVLFGTFIPLLPLIFVAPTLIDSIASIFYSAIKDTHFKIPTETIENWTASLKAFNERQQEQIQLNWIDIRALCREIIS